jgi:hypothetical protein
LRRKNTHTIRTDFGFNLLPSSSKLKRGVIKGICRLFWFFVIVDFSSPIFFVVFMCHKSWWGHCPLIVFSQIYCTFFMIYTYRLRFCEPFFSMWSSVFVLCLFFFLSTRCCQYYMNYWIHPPFNCWQNRTDLWGCRKGKQYLINYIRLHMFMKCDQKNLFTVPSIDQ